MKYEKYRKSLQSYVEIKDDDWNKFKQITKVTEHKKGTFIHHAGEINPHFSYYINYGLIRAYIYDTEGKDITWDFYFNDETAELYNMFIIDASAFTNKKESRITFEVLEDCQLVSVSHQAIQLAYDHLENGERASRILSELNSTYYQNRVFDRYLKTASQRYLDFTQKYPILTAKVKQSYIASYLGIMPESLSRIRKALK